MILLTLLCIPLIKICILHGNRERNTRKKRCTSSNPENFKYLIHRKWTLKRFCEVKMSNFSRFLFNVLLKHENHKWNRLQRVSLDNVCCMLVPCHTQQKWGDEVLLQSKQSTTMSVSPGIKKRVPSHKNPLYFIYTCHFKYS